MEVIAVLWLLAAAALAFELTDEQYHSLPRLFELDDYEQCLATRGAFCLGSFQLSARKHSKLLDVLQKYSADPKSFNRTLIHRGHCVTTTCAHIPGGDLPQVFQECVQNLTKTKHGLETQLLTLGYCKTKDSPPTMTVDMLDLGFACAVILILLANVLGTVYDVFRNPDNKPNRYLIAWSMIGSWRKFTYSSDKEGTGGQPLDPIDGMKAFTMIGVILVHAVIAYHMTYTHNPRYLEITNKHPLSSVLDNGTIAVQTFIVLSTFLLAYKLLVTLDTQPDKKIDVAFYFKILLHRISRISPAYMFVVGASATWWRHLSDGPLWSSLVADESARCREKWWTQALFVNNLVMADRHCLIQTWFLAVDMQLYLISSALLLFLLKRPHIAFRTLAGLFVLTLGLNFAINYTWGFKETVFISFPEYMRKQYKGVESFQYLYITPWSSLPSILVGLMLAFIYHRLRTTKYDLKSNIYFLVVYRLAVWGLGAWVLAGWLLQDTRSSLLVAVYSTLARPVFALMIAVASLGFFYKLDYVCWRILSWGGWRAPARMSLSVLLVHWSLTLSQLGVKTDLARASVFEIGGHALTTTLFTYLLSLPLHLLVELPAQRFLQAVI